MDPLLLAALALVGAASAWRLFRWYRRPRLRLSPVPRVAGDAWVLDVRNEGAATARACHGTLVRIDRLVDGTKTRLVADPDLFPLTWEGNRPRRDLAPGEAGVLRVARRNRVPPGRYGLVVAVIDGEEHRAAFEIEIGPDDDRQPAAREKAQ
ncbi:MAG: hypothetical protein RRA92_05880 [Gemmatimonadota bacterium]|nr:hypothetical protein [Gemmatimonadota bacterium]